LPRRDGPTEARGEPGSAGARNSPDASPSVRNPGSAAEVAVIASKREISPEPNRGAVHRGNRDCLDSAHGSKQVLKVRINRVTDRVGTSSGQVNNCFQVTSRTERAAAPGQDDDVRLTGRFDQRRRKLARLLRPERIA